MNRLRFLFSMMAACLLLTGGCVMESNSAQYRQEALRKQELADKAAAQGDKEAAERYAREARVAQMRAEEKRAEEEYAAEQKGDRDHLKPGVTTPSNLPAP
ncbi:MAG TPA: hypothetical protein VH877_02965 [Polyangia bacterium]|jgi:hypothetical protein|nr:hypothetical protein [Polyangia bacterium]